MAKKKPKPKTKAKRGAVPQAPSPPPGGYNPTQIPIAAAAELLSKEGQCTITPVMIEQDVQVGAPTNPDGTISVIAYAAWVLKQGM